MVCVCVHRLVRVRPVFWALLDSNPGEPKIFRTRRVSNRKKLTTELKSEGQAELAAKRPNRTRRGYCLEVKGRSAGKWFEGSVSSSNDP